VTARSWLLACALDLPPIPTYLLGAVCIAHLVIDVRNHLQRPT
jgi:hypothetical protein